MMMPGCKTAERTASDAAWMAGLGKQHSSRVVSAWMPWLLNRDFNWCGNNQGEAEWDSTLSPIHELDLVACLRGYPSFGGGVVFAAQGSASLLMASELLQLATTPTSLNRQDLLSDNVFQARPLTVVFADVPVNVTTSCDPPFAFDVRPHRRLRVVARPARKSRAFEMFSDVRDWLNLTTEEAATLVGVGRTTPLAWERDGREPRPARARRLYQVHSLISALVERLGRGATAEWLERGTPSPRERLERGEVDAVATAAERILIQRAEQTSLPERDAIVVEEPESEAAISAVPFPSTRRRRRRREESAR